MVECICSVTGHYTERVAAAVVKTIVEVVQLCHKLGTELNHKPARLVSVDVLKKYLEERIFPKLGKKKFTVLYVHIGVQRSENFAGISSLRSIYDAIPANVKENLEAFYFIHPGLQARLFLATFGRFLFNAGLYGKLRYVSRIGYLGKREEE
ncbi:calcium-dependent protein kinase [Trifolium repens]|nr:calcium-dependent protein kinase [Trifolium repens]KAK2432840.1 calcium-dependent protein kinase [Trifolium repens]